MLVFTGIQSGEDPVVGVGASDSLYCFSCGNFLAQFYRLGPLPPGSASGLNASLVGS